MGSFAVEYVRGILDGYADLIEGGTAYQDTSVPTADQLTQLGVPGTGSHALFASDGLTVGGSGQELPFWKLEASASSANATQVTFGSGTWAAQRWEKTDTPPFFLICTTATNAANLNRARKITGWNNTSKVFTVKAFDANITSGDVFVVAQGFKRAPDNFDINSSETGTHDGFDRFFVLSALGGRRLDWNGNGFHTLETEMLLRLRILKRGKARSAIASAFENSMILRSAITRGNINATNARPKFVQMVDPMSGQPEIETEDEAKIVLLDRFRLVYRVDSTYT